MFVSLRDVSESVLTDAFESPSEINCAAEGNWAARIVALTMTFTSDWLLVGYGTWLIPFRDAATGSTVNLNCNVAAMWLANSVWVSTSCDPAVGEVAEHMASLTRPSSACTLATPTVVRRSIPATVGLPDGDRGSIGAGGIRATGHVTRVPSSVVLSSTIPVRPGVTIATPPGDRFRSSVAVRGSTYPWLLLLLVNLICR